MSEDLGNHGGMFDGGDDFQGATALGALLDVDLEHSFERPAYAGRRLSTVLIVGLGGLGSAVALYLAAAGIGHLVLAD